MTRPRGSGAGSAGAAALADAFRGGVAGLIIGTVAIVFAISFAAIIYSGDLAAHLGRGIGPTLLGAGVMALAGAARLSYQGTIVQPQDVTAAIVGLGAANIAAAWDGGSPDRLFASVACLVAATTALTGLAAWCLGRFGLGFFARFIPYPVLGGFLASTGYLLLLGAIGMVTGGGASFWTLPALMAPDMLARWLPWVLAGIGLVVAARRSRHGLVLPGAVILIALGFHAWLRLVGLDLDEARAAGLLLGPFDSRGIAAGLDPAILWQADWRLILREFPTMATAAGMAIVGTLLYASALEIATERRIDPNRDLRGVGIANLLAAAAGGMTGYHLLSQTLFARALGVTGRLAGAAVAVLCVAALLFGANILSILPIGVFASVIAFLGADLLHTWLWQERRRLPTRDFAIVSLILAVAATIGFLPAIAVGLAASALQFIVGYARTDMVRLRTSLAAMRSRVERPGHEVAYLARHGAAVRIYVLSGYLFFGTASRLVTEITDDLAEARAGTRAGTLAGAGAVRHVVLDFARVPGIDASAAFALARFAAEARDPEVDVVLTGLSPELAAALGRDGVDASATMVAHLPEALAILEERLLGERPPGEQPPGEQLPGERRLEGHGGEAEDFLAVLGRLHPEVDLAAHFPPRHVEAGEVILDMGTASEDVILVLAGRLRAEAVAADGAPRTIATILPGTLVGEIGFYAGVERTATVVAAEPAEILVIGAAALARLTRRNPRFAADFHRLAARHLARRLMRTTALLHDGDL